MKNASFRGPLSARSRISANFLDFAQARGSRWMRRSLKDNREFAEPRRIANRSCWKISLSPGISESWRRPESGEGHLAGLSPRR